MEGIAMGRLPRIYRHPAACAVVAFGWLALGGSAVVLGQDPACQPHLVGADRRGPAFALARSGAMVYLGSGAALVVVDAEDPVHPIERGYVDLDGLVRGVASWGWTVAVQLTSEIEFIDATDPERPQVVGSLPLPADQRIGKLDVRDSLLYLPAPDGLHIASFADPANPVEVGRFGTAARATGVAARSNRAYLLADSVLHVLDTSDPAAPEEVAAVATPGISDEEVTVAPSGTRMATWGGRSSVGHSWGEVAFFDLADPDHPTQRGTLAFTDDDPPDDVVLAGGRAFVRHGGEFGIYDLSDLSDPELLQTVAMPASGPLLGAPDPGYVLAAEHEHGLRVYDVDPPSAANEVAAVETAGRALDGLFLGNLAVTSYTDGYRVYDVSDPSRPHLVGRGADANLGRGIQRVGPFAYSTVYDPAQGGFFVIFDLTDATAPMQVGTFGAGSTWRLAVDGDLALALGGSRAPFFDLSDPAHPVQVGDLLASAGLYILDVALSGDRVYAWTPGDSQSSQLWFFDVSDPARPVQQGVVSIPLRDSGTSAAAGTLLYACGGTEFAIFDVADPTDVRLVGSLSLPATGSSRHFRLHGERAILGPDYDGSGGPQVFRVIDLSDPAQPTQVAVLPTLSSANEAFAGAGLLGLADADAGVAFYDSCTRMFADGFESGDDSAWSQVVP
jgi:hypothetical protein